MTLAPYFDLAEAQALIALCTEVSSAPVLGQSLPPQQEAVPLPIPLIPANWTPVFKPSATVGLFDNYYEIWQNSDVESGVNQLAVVFSGTRSASPSIIEDLIIFMIPATLEITIPSIGGLSLQLAEDLRAGVHAGFTVGLAMMLFDSENPNNLLTNLKHCARSEANEIIITGHSQGAALATLFRSFVYYQPDELAISNVTYKTYAFAQPKPGNDYYGYDFATLAGNSGMGIRVINTLDWIPQAWFTLEQPSDWNTPNAFTYLEARFPKIAGYIGSLAASTGALINDAPDWLNDIMKDLFAANPNLHFMPSMNYVGCGMQYLLTGIPGDNPNDQPDAKPPIIDVLWQHYPAMYAKLLNCPTT
jgi:hypothetical protein